MRFIRGFFWSLIGGWIQRNKYSETRDFVLFVGYARSGHSLIASLIDAHPNAVISMEWGVLDHLRMGYRKNQLFYAIKRHARLYTSKLKNQWTGYSYKVEGLWQGGSSDIQVIGDKLAGQTSLILMKYPDLMVKLKTEIRMNIKLIHVIRNPFDTIATLARRSLEKSRDPAAQPDLFGFTDKYFMRVKLVESLKTAGKFSMFDLYHEDLIEDPGKLLKELLKYLELNSLEGYIEKCSEIVFESPHKSRNQYEWPEDLKEKIHSRMQSYEFLRRYSFTD